MIVPVPRLVAWELTQKCNLRCRHCRANAGKAVGNAEEACGELSFEEAKRVVDDIASFVKPILILTGGEPLLCPYLFDLVAYARARGLKPVIGTNATLVDAAMARRIAAAGVSRISVSVDFPTAEAHDAFRGVKGSFDAATSGIRAARAAGVEVQVNMTVTRLNRHLLEDMHALAVSLDAQALHPFLLVPTGRGADLTGEELSAEEYEEALSWVCERQRTSPLEFKPTDAPQYQRVVRQRGGCGLRGKGCLAGTGFGFIGHRGDVLPCGYFDLKLGNVRETPFSRIWAESSVLDDLRHPERLKGKCGLCSFKGVCGGCRARALAKTGDYLAEEPFCAYVPDRELLNRLQSDFPLDEHPYAMIGEKLGMSESACYERVLKLRAAGLVRRLGASFVSHRLGYVTCLVAARVAAKRLAEVADAINGYPQVTHNYARKGTYNLWFTVVATNFDEQRKILSEVASLRGVENLFELPAEKTYKLRAVFSVRSVVPTGAALAHAVESGRHAVPESCGKMLSPCEIDRNLVRKLQGDILDLGPTPLSALEWAETRALLKTGVIRRFGAFANHRKVGYVANALVVWQVPADSMDAAGCLVAESEAVSHCYVRATRPEWPYNLYAMVHADSRAALDEILQKLMHDLEKKIGGTVPTAVLETVRQYKKTSPIFYA